MWGVGEGSTSWRPNYQLLLVSDTFWPPPPPTHTHTHTLNGLKTGGGFHMCSHKLVDKLACAENSPQYQKWNEMREDAEEKSRGSPCQKAKIELWRRARARWHQNKSCWNGSSRRCIKQVVLASAVRKVGRPTERAKEGQDAWAGQRSHHPASFPHWLRHHDRSPQF